MPKTKQTKREEAEKRAAAYAALTKEQKLARLDDVPGSAKRQRQRLQKL